MTFGYLSLLVGFLYINRPCGIKSIHATTTAGKQEIADHFYSVVQTQGNVSVEDEDPWLPLVVSSCEGLDKRSAPCLQKYNNRSNIIKAQEIIYMPFTMKFPNFIDGAHRSTWVSIADADKELNMRMTLDESNNLAMYSTQYGQNLVFKDTGYFGSPADSWSYSSCMGKEVSHSQFLNEVSTPDAHEAILIATTPDSWSWQHFLDRVTTLWAQALLVMDTSIISEVEVVSGRQPQKIVGQLYDILGMKHLHGVKEIKARQLFFPCRTPLIHPYSIRQINKLLGVKSYPLEQRNVVLVMAREGNMARKIVNQDDFNSKVVALLDSRNKGETLVSFKINAFEKIEDIIKYISENVRMIIAPHGGALYNARFASSQTAILEFMPRGRFAPVIWEQSRLLDQNYNVYFVDSLDKVHNMRLDNIDEITAWIDSILTNMEKTPGSLTESHGVEPKYPWQV